MPPPVHAVMRARSASVDIFQPTSDTETQDNTSDTLNDDIALDHSIVWYPQPLNLTAKYAQMYEENVENDENRRTDTESCNDNFSITKTEKKEENENMEQSDDEEDAKLRSWSVSTLSESPMSEWMRETAERNRAAAAVEQQSPPDWVVQERQAVITRRSLHSAEMPSPPEWIVQAQKNVASLMKNSNGNNDNNEQEEPSPIIIVARHNKTNAPQILWPLHEAKTQQLSVVLPDENGHTEVVWPPAAALSQSIIPYREEPEEMYYYRKEQETNEEEPMATEL